LPVYLFLSQQPIPVTFFSFFFFFHFLRFGVKTIPRRFFCPHSSIRAPNIKVLSFVSPFSFKTCGPSPLFHPPPHFPRSLFLWHTLWILLRVYPPQCIKNPPPPLFFFSFSVGSVRSSFSEWFCHIRDGPPKAYVFLGFSLFHVVPGLFILWSPPPFGFAIDVFF